MLPLNRSTRFDGSPLVDVLNMCANLGDVPILVAIL